jgi:hypothetical protein
MAVNRTSVLLCIAVCSRSCHSVYETAGVLDNLRHLY